MPESTPQMSRESLERDFRQGLDALQTEVEQRDNPIDADVRPITDIGGEVIVRIGTWDVTELEHSGLRFASGQHTVFVKISQQFPTGNGKGVIAKPPLNREDGKGLNNNPWSQQFARKVEEEVGGPAESYSYNWPNVPMTTAEDMAKFVDVAEEFLQRG